jgi:predicted deacetylase
VPSWLTASRWRALRDCTGGGSQWYWHQHGRRHHNFEPAGKKQEFGPARSPEAIRASLVKGRDRLRHLQGDAFQPAFTPPWNRCSATTLSALLELGFPIVSRSRGSTPPAPAGLCEFSVNVDLHTRREPAPEASFASLLAELETALASGLVGIMLHHQRMNRTAVALLDLLLDQLRRRREISPLHFGELLASHSRLLPPAH